MTLQEQYSMPINDNQCPCIGCICLSMCRHKSIDKLTEKCSIFDSFIEANSIRYQRGYIRLTKISTLQNVYEVLG